MMDWSPLHVSLFNTCKINLVSYPLLLRYGSSKLVLLKTDWSANEMSYILMKPDNISESLNALRTLKESGNYPFGLT